MKSIMTSLKRFFGVLIAALALSALGCASTATRESTGQVIDDSAITTKVKKAIFDEPSLKVTQISVETNRSVVQLSGFVDSTAQVGTATSVARAVPGVVSVKNDLRLKYYGDDHEGSRDAHLRSGQGPDGSRSQDHDQRQRGPAESRRQRLGRRL